MKQKHIDQLTELGLIRDGYSALIERQGYAIGKLREVPSSQNLDDARGLERQTANIRERRNELDMKIARLTAKWSKPLWRRVLHF